MFLSFKTALEKEQIAVKDSFDLVDGHEIHLYGDERDDFSLLSSFTKPIRTVHYPLDRSDLIQVSKEADSEYFQKVIDLCKKANAMLVIHCDNPLKEVVNTKSVYDLALKLYREKVFFYLENGYKDVSCKEAYEIYLFLHYRLKCKYAYPLLDTCHLLISLQSFDYADFDFPNALLFFASDKFTIHLSDAIGSGEWQTGGVHGSNFVTNQALLKNILKEVKKLEERFGEANLVLEVEEDDFTNPIKAMALAKNVREIWDTL